MPDNVRIVNPLDDIDHAACRLWPNDEWLGNSTVTDAYVFRSQRIGCEYAIDYDASVRLRNFATQTLRNDESRRQRLHARLGTALINTHLSGESRPLVDESLVDQICEADTNLSITERMKRLMHFLVGFAANEKQMVELGDSSIRDNALGWSESISNGELDYLIDALRKEECIEAFAFGGTFQITIAGHKMAEQALNRAPTTDAFIAMWFQDDTASVGASIEKAIRAAGYKPMRIDKEVFAGLIDEAILERIEKSHFLVADLTHGMEGARGSVYYEAGLARAMGKEVILTARKDHLNGKIHFDLGHYQILTWTEDDLDRFEQELLARIKELVGAAPAEDVA